MVNGQLIEMNGFDIDNYNIEKAKLVALQKIAAQMELLNAILKNMNAHICDIKIGLSERESI